MADEFKGDRTSTPAEEDRFLEEIIPHTYVDVDQDGDLIKCEGRADPVNCACGALNRRELARWGLESAGSAGRIKVYERFAEVAGQMPLGVISLSVGEARQMRSVAMHQIAQFTAGKPEWLQNKLMALGLAG